MRRADHMPTASRARTAGFSLLELLVALTILALAMSVVSIAASRRSPSFEIQRLSSEAAGLLREARLTAQTTGQPVRIVFDADSRELRAPDADPVSIPEDVTANFVSSASAGASALFFFPDGSSSGGKLTLKGAGRTETVTIDWLTSRIERAGT